MKENLPRGIKRRNSRIGGINTSVYSYLAFFSALYVSIKVEMEDFFD